MNKDIQLKLKTSSVLQLSLQSYSNDFSFIVNGEEFKTSRVISDLLSPCISKIHLNDPTFNRITINTQNQGHFSYILNLINFEINNIPNDEIPFLSEIIKFLGNENIEIDNEAINNEITSDNVFLLLKKHEKFLQFYSKFYQNEIDFIAANFFELADTHENDLLTLSKETLFNVIDNIHFQLKDEDQLIKLINKLYSKDSTFSELFEKVVFENVSISTMKEFIDIYDVNDITNETWNSISKRLVFEIKTNEIINEKRYKKKKTRGIEIFKKENEDFNGIINYLRKKESGSIEDFIDITSSSLIGEGAHQRNAILYEDKNKFFETKDLSNSWICFEFKKNSIILNGYTIRSVKSTSDNHPRNWVIECSNDKKSWEILDKQENCIYLNG